MGYARDMLSGLNFLAGRSRAAFEADWARQSARRSPYQAWNDQHRAIFVHVPKAAGQSVKAAMGIHDDAAFGHLTAQGFRHADPARFDSYTVFAIVRDPVARLRSAFTYLRTTTRYAHDRAWAQRHLSGIDDFGAFVDRLSGAAFRARVMPWIHFRPQAQFLTDMQGRVIVDRIIRLEDVDRDLPPLLAELGIKAVMPRNNRSAPAPQDQPLDPARLAIIHRLYAEDFAILGYPALPATSCSVLSQDQ